MSKPSALERLARGWELSLRVEQKSPRTISRYLQDLGYLISWPKLPPDPTDISPATIREFMLDLQEVHAPSTVRSTLLAISLCFRFLINEGELDSNPTQGIKSPRVPVEPQPTYSKSDVEALRVVCSVRTKEGVRDLALILTLFSTGVRLGELLSMNIDLDRQRFTVTGKTGSREIPLGSKLALETDRYLRRWTLSPDAPIWRSLRDSKPLSGNGVLQIVRRLCRKAGVENRGIHAFRRSFAVAFKARSIELGIGGDSDLMEIAGWKSVTMLKRYTASEANTLAHQAFAKLDPADTLSA